MLIDGMRETRSNLHPKYRCAMAAFDYCALENLSVVDHYRGSHD